jgi:hypothetical protein
MVVVVVVNGGKELVVREGLEPRYLVQVFGMFGLD